MTYLRYSKSLQLYCRYIKIAAFSGFATTASSNNLIHICFVPPAYKPSKSHTMCAHARDSREKQTCGFEK